MTSLRHFTTSRPHLEEIRFLVDEGVYMTRSEVLAIDPIERTITQWRALVDWNLVKQRPYVIVDPMDPSGLLYLSQKDYLAYAKVSASTDFPFIVVCRPGIKRPESLVTPNNSSSTDSSQNSPWGVQWEGKLKANAKASWSTFCRLRNRIHLLVNKSKAEDKMVSENLNSITRTVLVWARTLAHYAEVKKAGSVPFYLVPYSGYLKRILKTQGQMALVLHLKVALFALYSYISGNPLTSTYSLGSAIRLDRSGLPVAWGIKLRSLIRGNKLPYIRLMASLLNIYRAMDAPHKEADISSIVAKHPDFSQNETFREFQYFVRHVFPNILKNEIKDSLEFKYETGLGLIIRSAGANTSGPAMGSLCLDAKAWFNQPENHVLSWFQLHEDVAASRLMEIISKDNHFATGISNLDRGLHLSMAYMATRTPFSKGAGDNVFLPNFRVRTEPTPVVLGRLHAIDEPAGKVRVVAICDYWTQVAMKPVHEHLFKILRGLGTDATFDQSGIVDRYYNRGLSPHWSFDLKSATDKIPLALYIEVMAVLLQAPGEDTTAARQRAELWAKIMTDRDFLTPDKQGYARYGTGQPMGALSSWASMAIVHHALVQFSAYRCKLVQNSPSWYQDYLVLGDDIDIARNHLVAENYQHICAELAITIGLLKSLRSEKNCFEFANMRFSPDGNISPLSLKEELASTTWIARLEYAKRILARFGTSYVRPGMALLRKATTVAQWDVLTPELSGMCSDTPFLNAVRFLLENPFTRLNSNEEVPIESIIGWLATLVPMQDKGQLNALRFDTSRIRRLKGLITKELLKYLDMEIKDALKRIPDPKLLADFSYDTTRGKLLYKCCEISHLSTKTVTGSSGVTREEIYVMMPNTFTGLVSKLEDFEDPKFPEAAGALLYNLYCFNLHNGRIEDDLKLLQRKCMILNAYLRDPRDPLQVMEADRAIKASDRFGGVTSVYDATLGLWAEFNSVPKIIKADFDHPINDWLPAKEDTLPPFFEIKRHLGTRTSVDRILRIIEERAKGPIRAIGSAFAEETGIIIPSLPYLAFEKASMKGTTWNALVKRFQKASAYARGIIVGEQYAQRLNRGVVQGKIWAFNMVESLTALQGGPCSGIFSGSESSESPGLTASELEVSPTTVSAP